MSRTTISTGSFSLDASADKEASTKRPDAFNESAGSSIKKSEHCHMVFLADFSGRGHRGLNDASGIQTRKIIEVDRDTFDEVFAQMDVRCALPMADEISFSELDDMHPDYLYEHIDLFNKFRSLRKKLKNPATFASAAQEIYAWHSDRQVPVSDTSQESRPEATDGAGSLLDSILSGAEPASSNGMDLQALVKEIVAPFVTPKPDPQQKELIETVDQAASDLMRKIMHHPQFQTIESAWRSLYLLVRRLETDSKLKLFMVDVSQQELIDDALSCDAYKQTQLYKLLVDRQSAIGGKPFNVIMADAIFGEQEDDIAALSQLGKLAASSDALLVTGGSIKLAGCEDLAKTPDRDDWSFSHADEVKKVWHSLREMEQAANIIAVAPRYLTRMPYGKKSAPIDSFHFEELPDSGRHGYYLWSNGAWLLSLVLAQGFSINGDITKQSVQEIERLPLHVYTEDDESVVTPCAEVNMLDDAASAFYQSGLTVVRTVLNKDSVMIPEIISLAI